MRRSLIPLALAVGVLWCWAVLRLALVPQDAGPVEGAVAVGGWGLGLLPVHCVPGPPRRRRGGDAAVATTAWRRRRSGGGSGPS